MYFLGNQNWKLYTFSPKSKIVLIIKNPIFGKFFRRAELTVLSTLI
jgi:hypothetical protein